MPGPMNHHITPSMTPSDGPIVILSLNAIGHQHIDADGNIEFDITPSVIELLQELASIVTLILSCTGALGQVRAALRHCGIYDCFGDIRIAGSMTDIPAILRRLGLSGRPFIVGRHETCWHQDYTYVPSLSLLYGALAGQNIVLATVHFPGGASEAALGLLRRSSVVPVYRHPAINGFFIVYLCEGTRSHLEAAGFEIVELGDGELVAQSDLFAQHFAQHFSQHFAQHRPVGVQQADQMLQPYQVYSDGMVQLVAIPANPTKGLRELLIARRGFIHLTPDNSLFSMPTNIPTNGAIR